ncbi:MAG: TonB-dependent receptor [Melioribacteraceae bacterium]|nr:TonB-dependent receptor [Melioribacteraceae bacterium]
MDKSYTIGYKALKLYLLMILLLSSTVMAQSTGSIKGTVKDSGNDDVLIGANVFLPGASTGASTDIDGEYIISNIPAGTHQVLARFVGYKQQTIEVVVLAGKSTQLDFFLDATAVQLDELVVTGVGSAVEKRKLTSTVSTISVDEIKSAPVESIDHLLQGRVPGLSSFSSSGMPGTAGRIATRGIKSVSTSSTPVIYVDGVRVDNGAAFRLADDTGGAETSALSDLVVGEIDRVEVIKGGAASTLYGSEAANGVIQIFTKKGVPGKPKWTFGVTTGFDEAEEYFVVEDYTKDNFFQKGAYQKYLLGVSGGNELLSYTLNGSAFQNDGIMVKNNSQSKTYNFNAGFRLHLDDTKNLEISTSYTKNQYNRPLNNNVTNAPFGSFEQADYGDQYDWNDAMRDSILNNYMLKVDNKNDIDRFRVSANFDYKPIENFTNKITLGMDYRKSEERNLIPKVAGDFYGTKDGSLYRSDREYSTVTMAYNGSYILPNFGPVEQTINFGFQGFRIDDRETFNQGLHFGLPGTDDFDNAADITSGESNQELFNYGFYITDLIGLYDNLFVDLGLRVDGNSTFGDDIGLQYYPKAGIAYNVTDEEYYPAFLKPYISTLKIRAAWGMTGNFPQPFRKDRSYLAQQFLGQTALIPYNPRGNAAGNPGNDELGPEKTSSIDIGFDMGLFNDKALVEFNYFQQTTEDALFQVPQDPTIGYPSQLTNVGEISNKGIELSIFAKLYSSRNFSVDMRASISTNENEITSLGGSSPFTLMGYTFLPLRIEEGHAVGAFRIQVPNGDGTSEEIVTGSPTPKQFGNLSFNFDILQDLTLSVMAEYALGHQAVDLKKVLRYFNGTDDTGEIVPDGYNFMNASSVWLEDADWVKLREISLSYRLPQSIFNGVSLSASCRNVAVLYTEMENDPELNSFQSTGAPAVGGYLYSDISAPRQYRLSLTVNL